MGAQSMSWIGLVELVGIDVATIMCAEWGGGTVYVPKKFDYGKLIVFVGEQAARKLSEIYGGITLALPNEIRKPKPKKTRILQLLEAGYSADYIRRATGVTEKWVSDVKKSASRKQIVRKLPIHVP